MQAGNVRPKKPFRQQLEDAVSLKFGGAGLERFVYYGTPLEDSQLQDGPQCESHKYSTFCSTTGTGYVHFH